MAGRVFNILKIYPCATQEHLGEQHQTITHKEDQTHSTPVVGLVPKDVSINITTLKIVSAEEILNNKPTFPQKKRFLSCKSLVRLPQGNMIFASDGLQTNIITDDTQLQTNSKDKHFLGRTTSLKISQISYLCK